MNVIRIRKEHRQFISINIIRWTNFVFDCLFLFSFELVNVFSSLTACDVVILQ